MGELYQGSDKSHPARRYPNPTVLPPMTATVAPTATLIAVGPIAQPTAIPEQVAAPQTSTTPWGIIIGLVRIVGAAGVTFYLKQQK